LYIYHRKHLGSFRSPVTL